MGAWRSILLHNFVIRLTSLRARKDNLSKMFLGQQFYTEVRPCLRKRAWNHPRGAARHWQAGAEPPRRPADPCLNAAQTDIRQSMQNYIIVLSRFIELYVCCLYADVV